MFWYKRAAESGFILRWHDLKNICKRSECATKRSNFLVLRLCSVAWQPSVCVLHRTSAHDDVLLSCWNAFSRRSWHMKDSKVVHSAYLYLVPGHNFGTTQESSSPEVKGWSKPT
eukprot:scaffold248319_cov40-Tisochrysis_lutea.AAC.2